MPLSDLAPVGLAWLGTYLVHSTLLLGAAWLLTRTRWFSLPHVSERFWRVSLIGGVLTASLQVGLGYAPLLGNLHITHGDELARLDALRDRLIGEPNSEARSATEEPLEEERLGFELADEPTLLRLDPASVSLPSVAAGDTGPSPTPSLPRQSDARTAGDLRCAQPGASSPRLTQPIAIEASRADAHPDNLGSVRVTEAQDRATGDDVPTARERRIALLAGRASEARTRLQAILDAGDPPSDAAPRVTPDLAVGDARTTRFVSHAPGGRSENGLEQQDAAQVGSTHGSDVSSPPPTRASAQATPLGFALARVGGAAERMLAAAPWRMGLMVLWVALAGLGLAGFLWAASRLLLLLSDKREITSGPMREQLDQLRDEAGVTARVRLFASDTLLSPITYGWFERRICVPTRVITELSASQKASILAHELAHAVRRDPLWFSTYTVLERLLFFQPLNRIARRRLQDNAELLCDEWAVRWTGGRLALASCLTEIAQWIVGRQTQASAVPGMASRPSQLGQRVERLLDDELASAPHTLRRWWLTGAGAGLGLVVFAVPGVSSQPTLTEFDVYGRLAERWMLPAASATPLSNGTETSDAFESVLDDVDWPSSDATFAPDALGLDASATESESPDAQVAPDEPALDPVGLTADSEQLSTELVLLERELTELRDELRSVDQYPRFERALSLLEDRIDSLHQGRERLHALLTLVSSNLVPERDAEPGSENFPKD